MNNKIKSLLKNRWFKFSVVAIIYLLWFVVWVGSLWALLGLVVIYDIYISKKMHKLVWSKHKEQKNRSSLYRKSSEWVEAIAFATVVASLIRVFFFEMYVIPTSSMEGSLLVGDYLCVSKMAYGPKMPNTPLSFPFVHHTMPFSTDKKSFVEWIKKPYHRLWGPDSLERNDVVVFNFPAGDTVAMANQAANYYDLLRDYQLHYGEEEGRQQLWSRSEIVARPVDKRENYIKRAVAVSGDVIEVRHTEVYINDQKQIDIPGRQYVYFVETQGSSLSPIMLEELGISQDEISYNQNSGTYIMPLNDANYNAIAALPNVVEVKRYESTEVSLNVFPNSSLYPWTEDNFGPLWVPQKGSTVDINMQTLPLYQRIIETYEGNELEVKDGVIYINGEKADSYTFKMDYYFMMGDNRHNSLDSRFWGFVPEDHVVGRASFKWLSLDKNKSFPSKVRWSRLFKGIE
ncbi:MAG: signal peptidase I [Rikenellaceae bacterium]